MKKTIMKTIFLVLFVAFLAVSNGKLALFGGREAERRELGNWGREYLTGFISAYSRGEVSLLPEQCGTKYFEDKLLSSLREFTNPAAWLHPCNLFGNFLSVLTEEIDQNCEFYQLKMDINHFFMFLDAKKIGDLFVRALVMIPAFVIEQVAATIVLFTGDYRRAGSMDGYTVRKILKGLWA